MHKQVYIYGSLDFSPTVIDRKFGLAWSVGGYLLTTALARLGGEAIGRMRARVLAEAKTTFASGYAQTIGLRDVLAARDPRRLRAPQHRDEVPDRPIQRPSNVTNPWQDSDMERVLGIGGYFMRAADPVALGAWYRDCLGLDADENGGWRQESGLTVFATFESETDYFGSRAQQTMLNFRIRDLDAMLAQLRAKGADVAEETQEMEGVGRFGWVTDPEGNRVELWQPA